MKGPRKNFKIFTASNPVNEFRPQLYLFFKVRIDSFLYSSLIQIRSLSQKLVFKVKLIGGMDPVGVWRVRPPLESVIFFDLKS